MCVTSVVCKSEKRDEGVFRTVCPMWKSAPRYFNGTVTFLSEITGLKISVKLSERKGVLRSKDRNACRRAVRQCAETHACASLFQVRERECSGLPI